MKGEKQSFQYMYIWSNKLFIMIENVCPEIRVCFFWDTLYNTSKVHTMQF